MLACHSIRFFHLLSSTQQPSSPPHPTFDRFIQKQQPQHLSPAFINTIVSSSASASVVSSPISIFSLADFDMPAAPKAAVLGKGQKSATTPTTSPAVSVSKPSPSSAGMSTPAQPPTPLSKNQKKKSKGAAATSPATANGSVLSTPAANIAKQQESSAKQQVTPAVESLGIKEDNTPAWVKEIEEEPSNKLEFDEESAPPETPRFAHTFRWMKGGNVVKVSGSFDNWNEQIELRKNPNNSDQSEIIIDVDHAINNYFKFIVDGQWKCSDEYPTEYDSAGNLNNVLYPLRN